MRTTGTFNIAWPRLLKHRQDFRFSFQPVLIRLSQDGNATVSDASDSAVICRVPAVANSMPMRWEPGDSDRPFEGSIEAVQLDASPIFVVCVLVPNGLIAVLDCRSGLWNPAPLVDRLDDMPSAIAVEGAMHAFAEWQSRTRVSGDIRDAIAFHEEQAHQAVDLIYLQLACPGRQTDELARVARAFDAQGIYSI